MCRSRKAARPEWAKIYGGQMALSPESPKICRVNKSRHSAASKLSHWDNFKVAELWTFCAVPWAPSSRSG